MAYSRDIYESAYKKLEQQRQLARQENEKRKSDFYLKFPRAKQIEKQLSSTAISVAKAVLNGSDTVEQLKKLKEQNLALQNELSDLLKSQGLPHNYLETKFSCSNCNDEGYIDGKMCACLKNMLRKEAFNKLNQLSPLSLSTFESFSVEYYSDSPIRSGGPSPKKRMSDIFNFCKNYAANFSRCSQSLLMTGATGLGKTHLSLAIARVAINKGFGVIYGSTPNIVNKLEKERFRYNRTDDNNEAEQYLMDCDLLILDDLGTEFATSFSNAAIYNIINSRMMMDKPTIINTNLSLKELEKNYSERLVSRLMGNSIKLDFIGEDIRPIKQREKWQESKS